MPPVYQAVVKNAKPAAQVNTPSIQLYFHFTKLTKLHAMEIFEYSKYEPISIKIGRIVLEETLNKTVPKMPISPKVCACTTLGNLKCQIEPLMQ